MIFQCYYRPEHRARCFTTGPYTPLNLSDLVDDPYDRDQLSEYAAFGHVLQNPHLNPHSWVGFTSYRQLDKINFQFKDDAQVELLLKSFDVVVWGRYRFFRLAQNNSMVPTTYLEESEALYPGITRTLQMMMASLGHGLPRCYTQATEAASCVYFACKNETFKEWVDWSLPLVAWHLHKCRNDKANHDPRIVGYTYERLLEFWFEFTNKKVAGVGPYGVACVSLTPEEDLSITDWREEPPLRLWGMLQ